MEPEVALTEALIALQRRDFARAAALLRADARPLARSPGPGQRSFYMARARLALLDDLFAEADALAGAAERSVMRREEDPDAWLEARALRVEIALVAGDPDQAERLLPEPAVPLLQAQIAWARGDLEGVRAHVGAAAEGTELAIIAAHLRAAEGSPWRAHLEHLEDDARIAGVRTRLALSRGDASVAAAWLARTDRDNPFIPTPLTRRDFTKVVTARCLAATGRGDEARALLEAFLAGADARPLCQVDGLLALAEAGDPDAHARALAVADGRRGPFFAYAETLR